MFLYLLIVLELKPYQNFADDMLSLVTTVSTLLIAMCGLLLKLDESAPQGEKNFNPVIMGNVLVALTSFTIFCCLLNLVLVKMKVWVLVEKRWAAKGSSVNSTRSGSGGGGGSSSSRRRGDGGHQTFGRAGTIKGSLRYNAKVAVELKKAKDNAEAHEVSLASREQQREVQRIHAKSRLANRLQSRGRVMKKAEERKPAEKVSEELEEGRGIDMKEHMCKVVPVTSPAVDQSQEVQALRQSLFKLMRMDTSKDILSKVFRKIDSNSSNLLDKGELFKLIHGALKKKPQKLLFDAVWADVSCNDAQEVSVNVLREWLTSGAADHD